MDLDKRMSWAQFRFSVIAPLVCRKLSEDERRMVRRQILQQTFLTPDGYDKQIAPRTLNEWLARHRKAGFDGLLDARRTTLGSNRSIPNELIDRAVELRREIPSRSVKMLLHILQSEGIDTTGICKTTLNVHLNQRGASRAQLCPEKGAFQRWEQPKANILWQADTSRGPWLPDPQNPKKMKQTKLISFIDDASRVCTHAEFYWDEKLPSLIDCFRKALLKRGKPEKLLFDNGSIFRSNTMAIMCAQLNIRIVFCKKESPETKGKVEKHYSTIKSSFYKEAEHCGLTTLDELNQFFFAWLTREYHHARHSQLGITPLERWRQDEHTLERVRPDQLRDALMLRANRAVNKRTALIQIDNNTFQASPDLAGRTVEVRWHAGRCDNVEVWHNNKLVEIAPLITPQANIDFSRKQVRVETPRGITFESSKRYRQALLAAHHGEAVNRDSAPNEYLSETEFVDMLATSLDKTLLPEELGFLSTFFYRYSPLRKTLVQSLLNQIINAKGKHLHVRSYLDYILTATFKIRR